MSTDDPGTRLHTLLAERMTSETPPPPVPTVVATCRRDLRTRRARLAAAGAVLLVLAVAVPTAIWSHQRTVTSPAIDVPHLSDDQVIDLCLQGNQGPDVTRTFTASGRPALAERAEILDRSTIALVSADGRYWADCFVNYGPHPEFRSGMTVYDTTLPSRPGSFSAGYACTKPCDTFMVDYLDRLPSAVAAVDFLTADGRTTRVPTDDLGFVIFTYTAPVPDGYPLTDGWYEGWLTQMTYVGADGSPLAAAKLGYIRDEDRRVGDLPLPERRYPSLASQPVE